MKHILITTIAAVLLVGCGSGVDIHYAARAGHIEAVKQYLAAGEDVNMRDDNGITPLHWAAYQGTKEVVELLIGGGADVNAKKNDSTTPIDWAIRTKRTEIDNLLRKHGGKTGEELKAEGK